MVLVGALAVAAVAGLALRDLPRRWVEGFLADGLYAQVELDSFSIRGPSSFELGGIRIFEPALWPEIREIRVESLGVEAGIRAALAGKYRELVFDGVEVVASPIVGHPALPPEPAPAVEADLVEVRRGRAILDAGGGPARLRPGGRPRRARPRHHRPAAGPLPAAGLGSPALVSGELARRRRARRRPDGHRPDGRHPVGRIEWGWSWSWRSSRPQCSSAAAQAASRPG